MALVFAYGSLVDRASAARTLGEPIGFEAPVTLRGWRRRWTTVRDNLASEKTFAPAEGGEPFPHCLALNLEPAGGGPGLNGALLRLSARQVDRLDVREMRYERVEVGATIEALDPGDEPVIAYVAKARHRAERPPDGAVILASYLRAVESAFAGLGRDQLRAFRASTDPPPVDVVEGRLVSDRIPAGNPREW